MAKANLIILKDHTVIIPETVLETRLSSDGPVVSSIPVPEIRYEYKANQILEFRSKKDAKAAVNKFGPEVARIVEENSLQGWTDIILGKSHPSTES